MNQNFLKTLLKKIKQEEDMMSLLFGALALASLLYLAVSYTAPRLQRLGVNEKFEVWFSDLRSSFTPKQENQTIDVPAQADTIAQTHRTTKEDTLWKLAQQYYNDGHQWVKIYEANKSVISNPNILEKDLELVIPE